MIVIILFAIASQETRLCPAEICFSGHMLSGQRHNPVKQSSVLNASIKVWLRYFLCFSRGKSFLNHSSLPIPQKLMMPFFREKGMSSKKQKMEEKNRLKLRNWQVATEQIIAGRKIYTIHLQSIEAVKTSSLKKIGSKIFIFH